LKTGWGKTGYLVLAVLLVLALAAGCGGTGKEHRAGEIRLATTTSTYDSGLLDAIIPVFEERHGYRVSVISVGTGAALEIGKRGDCDVLLVHSREQELELVRQGYFVDRHDVMYNDFVLVGPPADPAGIAGGRDVVAAFRQIAEAGAVFISRGDDSGTHRAELAIWRQTGIEPHGAWYRSVGQGMGDTLRIAGEMQGYTLADRGTWVAMKDRLDLKIVLEGDPVLFNQYGVMAVNPEKHPRINHQGAAALIDFMISGEGQELIARFERGGERLFVPNAHPVRQGKW